MSDEGSQMTPEQIFKKIVWRQSISMGESMEKFTTWTITGCAALVGLIISNLDSINSIIPITSLRYSIILFVASMLFGVLSKMFGMALTSGINLINDMENKISSSAGKNLMDSMSIEPKQLVKELSEVYWWPLSCIMRKAGNEGVKDYLSSDKRLVNLFCTQLFTNFIHIIFAALALVAVTACI